jgi:hypothetical protein
LNQVARAFSFVLAFLAFACGGGDGPVGVDSTARAPLAVVDGWTEQPVSASTNPDPPAAGSALSVSAPGFLTRELTWNGGVVQLWPSPLEYVQAVVYMWREVGNRLSRWTSGGFTIGLGALMSDAAVLTVATEAAAEISARTGLVITLAEAGNVAVAIDPNDPGIVERVAALTYVEFQGNRIVSARVVFRAREAITGGGMFHQNTFLHEMGHVIGLGHSPDTSDVMHPGGGPGRTQARTFNTPEAIVLKLMYRFRQPGNAAPDRAPDAGVTDRTTRIVPIVD